MRKSADEPVIPQTLASRLMPAALAGSMGLIYGATQAPGDSVLRGALIGGLGGAGAGLGFSAGNAFMESDAAKNMRSPGIGAGMALGGGALGLHGGLLAGRAIAKRTGLGDEDDKTSDDLKEIDLMRNAKYLPAGLGDYVKRSNAQALPTQQSPTDSVRDTNTVLSSVLGGFLGSGLGDRMADNVPTGGYADAANGLAHPNVQRVIDLLKSKLKGSYKTTGLLAGAGLAGGAAHYLQSSPNNYVKRSDAQAPAHGLMDQLASRLGYAPKAQPAPEPVMPPPAPPAPPKPGGMSTLGGLGAIVGLPAAGYAAHKALPGDVSMYNGLNNTEKMVDTPAIKQLLGFLKQHHGGVRKGAVGAAAALGGLGAGALGNYMSSGQPKQAADALNRQLDSEELAQITAGKKLTRDNPYSTIFDPIATHMRSPDSKALESGIPAGVATGAVGGIAGSLPGLLRKKPSGVGAVLGALAGALGVGGAVGRSVGNDAWYRQDAKNRELESGIRRLPKGSAMRDIEVHDPVTKQRELFKHRKETYGQGQPKQANYDSRKKTD